MILLAHTPAMRRDYFGNEALARLHRLGPVRLHEGDAPLEADALVAAAQGCRVIVADRRTPGPGSVFQRLPGLTAFARVAVDISTVDVAAASAAGVLVTQAGPGFVASVTELVVGLMVDLARGVSGATARYRAGLAPQPAMGAQLAGSVLGLIGYGAIGRHLAAVGVALGMTVLVADPHVAADGEGVRQVALAALLAGSDWVVCLAKATPETHKLMDAAAFARMKPTARFINVSRGELVDEAALAAALQTGQIAGAALDVGSAPDQMPPSALGALPGVLATPHIGGLTVAAVEAQALEVVDQVAAILRGAVPPGAVNAEQWRRQPGAM